MKTEVRQSRPGQRDSPRGHRKKTLEPNGTTNQPRTIPKLSTRRFISHEFQDWCDGNGIKILYTQPGCPTQNSYIERFNGSYRRAVLDAYIFRTLDDVREITEKWTDYYNNERPHDSLNNLAPMEYRLMRTG